MRKYKQISTELTFRCNAKCPACHRVKPLRINLNDSKYTITLDNFRNLFYSDFLNNLEWLVINGNFGDSVMNKEFREILEYVKSHGTRINIHTNGGIHSADYWKDVGNILTEDDIVNFDIDGLEDTHHIYRINTTYDKVMENARSLISTKRPKVHWKYIVFQHNEHQVEEARRRAIEYGFKAFSAVKTSRGFSAPVQGPYAHSKKVQNIEEIPKQIICSWHDWGKWYVSPDGNVFRCCWTGGHYYDKVNERFYYPPDFERLFNGFHVPLEKILNKRYWEQLQSFLQGYDRSFKLCKSQCGRIISSREKIEEDLETGSVKHWGAGEENDYKNGT